MNKEEARATFDRLTNINKTTQKAQNILRAYERSTETELWEVYGTFSQAKQNAMEYCKNLQYKLNGQYGVIIGYCSTQFSFAFQFEFEGKKYLCYITKSHDYKIEL